MATRKWKRIFPRRISRREKLLEVKDEERILPTEENQNSSDGFVETLELGVLSNV